MAEAGLLPATVQEAVDRLAERLAGVDELVLAAHVDPDGDAIGSMCALALALGRAGKRVYPALAQSGEAPRTYRWLPGFELLRQPAEAPHWPVVLALDAPALSRLGEVTALARSAELTVRIDHHPLGQRFSPLDVVDETAPATVLLVWRLLVAMGCTIEEDVALALYAGLVTDTGRFQYSNTTWAAFEMARELVRTGVSPSQVFREVYDTKRLAALRLVALVIERAMIELDGRFVWASISEDDVEKCGATGAETENLIDEIRAIEGIDVALLLKKHSDGLRGSLRSKGRVDVARIAHSLGGGGHREAAGFPFEGPVEEAVIAVRELVKEALGLP